MKLYIKYSDQFGVTANVLCMLHCLLTPFLFVFQAKTATYFSEITFFWSFLNYFLLAISFIAVYQSAKKTTNNIVKYMLITTWMCLSFLIINEGFELYHLPEALTYAAASTLAFTHIYNLKYCNCKDEECCVKK